MDPFDVYKTYIALKLHFTGNYDYFKYHGKCRANWQSFEKAKGKNYFSKIGKRYKSETPDFMARCFADGIKTNWIGDFDCEECDIAWKSHKKYTDAIDRSFKMDLITIKDMMEVNNLTFKSLFECEGGELPPIEKARKKALTSLETCSIIHLLTNYGSKVKCVNPLWEDTARMLTKYSPFVRVKSMTKYADMMHEYVI